MSAPLGNQYAAKDQKLTRALDRALAADDYRRLHQGCDKLADAFAACQPWAVQMVFDRIEGKAIARVETTSGDARQLDLAAVMQIIIEHRKLGAVDAQPIDSTAVPALPVDPDPAGTP